MEQRHLIQCYDVHLASEYKPVGRSDGLHTREIMKSRLKIFYFKYLLSVPLFLSTHALGIQPTETALCTAGLYF